MDDVELLRAENKLLRRGNDWLALQLLIQIELANAYLQRVEMLEVLEEHRASQEPLV